MLYQEVQLILMSTIKKKHVLYDIHFYQKMASNQFEIISKATQQQ